MGPVGPRSQPKAGTLACASRRLAYMLVCIICRCVYQAESSVHLHITQLDVKKELEWFNCKEPAYNDRSYFTGPVLQTWALIGHKEPTEPLHN